MVELDHEVIDLLAVFIKLVLAEEDGTVPRSPAFILEALGVVRALRTDDQLGVFGMTLNPELKRQVLWSFGLFLLVELC